jgi:hypothetical protein
MTLTQLLAQIKWRSVTECEVHGGSTKGVDPNTLSQTRVREDGHRFKPCVTYDDRTWEGTCLKCGMVAHLTPKGKALSATFRQLRKSRTIKRSQNINNA